MDQLLPCCLLPAVANVALLHLRLAVFIAYIQARLGSKPAKCTLKYVASPPPAHSHRTQLNSSRLDSTPRNSTRLNYVWRVAVASAAGAWLEVAVGAAAAAVAGAASAPVCHLHI